MYVMSMTTLSIVDARNKLADALNRVSYTGERVMLARRGKPVAVLVSVQDVALQKLAMVRPRMTLSLFNQDQELCCDFSQRGGWELTAE